jgi:type I restriction enzyme, S subunit
LLFGRGEVAIVGELPKGWEWAEINDIAYIITGKTPSTTNSTFWGGDIPFVTPSQINISGGILPSDRTLTVLGAEQARIVPEKSVLAVCIGSVGKIGLLHHPSVINQQLNAIVPCEYLSSPFLYYWAKYFLSGWIVANASATVNAAILNKSRLGSAPILFPPLNEQRRIADRLDHLLTRIDKTKAHLDRIPPLLKRFRQSVLAAATSGKLTEDWREANAKPEEFTDYFLANILDLDLGFAFKSAEFLDEGTRLLRGDNIEPGKLRWKDAKCLPSENLKDFAHLMLDKGDIVLAMDRPIISSGLKIARVGEDDVPSVLVQRVCRFRPHGVLDINYLYLVLSSSDFISHLGDQQTGTQIPHISGKQILAFEISLPSLKEQHEIVRRVETLFAKADRIETQYKKARQEVDRLTPALLAKAFRGELVPQDPKDEPASVLLERINGEKKGREKREKGRSKKTS